ILRQYEGKHAFFGCFVGRNANRIGKGQIEIDGKTIQLSTNEGENQLHGGFTGFQDKVWDYSIEGEKLILKYTSADGEEGFPGKLEVATSFEIINDSLVMNYWATADKTTVVNLTRHEYFNLAQGESKNILDHKLSINADYYLPKTDDGLPTGEIVKVEGTPFDLKNGVTISDKVYEIPGGYDNNFVLNARSENEPAAVLVSPTGNLKLELFCTQPGIQFFSANDIGGFTGKYGDIEAHSPGLCLEPQHFPDTPNNDNFPSTILKPSEEYHHTLRYKFS
ncbi:MAG: aldose epimerase family protein, partial [Leeuwenhoekiella sp.]